MAEATFWLQWRLLLVLLLLALVTGCGDPDARTGAAEGQPLSPPGRSSTPFTEPLACLNQQLQALQILTRTPTRLGAGTLPDVTGKISPGLRDMVTTAMMRATQGSSVFVVSEALALGQLPIGGGAAQIGGALIRVGVVPSDPSSVQIYGALTQADRNVQGVDERAGAGTTTNVFGISKNADIANVGIDLHLAHVGSGVILQSVSNQMTVRNLSRGANADFKVGSIGLTFEASFDEREGLHQAVRTLVELSVLELLGQQARVPYWHCFQLNRGNPVVLRRIAAWFRDLGPDELDTYVRQRLRALGFFVADAPESMAPALAEFQLGQRLVPSGQPTFETFAALVDGQLASGPPGPTPVSLPAPAPSGTRRIKLDVTELAIPEPLLQLSVQPDRVGRLVCYYRDDTGTVWRLLPNRYQPDQTVSADEPLLIPGRLANRPVVQPHRMTGDVGFLCAAGDRDWSAVLPADDWGGDLSRLPGVTFARLHQALLESGGADTVVIETTYARPSSGWSVIHQLPQ